VQHFNGVVWCGPLHLAFPDDVAHACININKWHKKKNKNKKVTLHMLTSLVVCNNDKIHDIRERNVTIRSEI
jgi:hypothetical protein